METTTPSATWRLFQIPLELGEPEAALRERAARLAGFDARELRGFRWARKALDARVRAGARRVRFVCNVDLVVDAGARPRALRRLERSGRARPAPEPGSLVAARVHACWRRPGVAPVAPVAVVGAGPAGLFAAFALAYSGVPVVLLERGPALRERGRALVRFHRTRVPDPEANLLFGEGGAGTYSDGKIYTRVDDPLEVPVLEELVAAGAPPAIVYDALAHIGTDKLHRVLPRLRARLEELGARFLFDTRVDALLFDEGAPGPRVRALATTSGEVPCSAVVLAVGHSARDTWGALARQGLVFEAKPFQLGLRIEHPQELIDAGRYGEAASALGPASYNLVCRAGDGAPGAHSFCMCPGGRIVASIHEDGHLCTNGMSNSKHSSGRATSALVTTFGPRDFGAGAFDGVGFQRELERRFFAAGGGDYTAPAQTAADFLAGREAAETPRSTFTFGTRPARLDRLLPERATVALARALLRFERALPGFAGEQGLFVGLESRSSGPVRMARDAVSRRALGFPNVLPVGEGAGWAGGIMSAALDGAHAGLELATRGA